MATARKAHTAHAPLAYFGGKQTLVPTLIDLLPPHEVYVETHGGSGALLCSKLPSKLEVYNDLDSGCVNFYRVLRDTVRCTELTRLLELTPYSREEWLECRTGWRDAPNEVEMARRWFVAVTQSFSKTPNMQQGWSYCKQPNGHAVSKFRGLATRLSQFTQRLALVQIEHLDALDLIRKYDAPNVCFYVDPPYLPSTRKMANTYAHEMTQDDHATLLATITQAQGKVLLSGYRNALYDEALAGWRRVDVATVNWSSNTTREKRVECVWINPQAWQHQPMLPFRQEEVMDA